MTVLRKPDEQGTVSLNVEFSGGLETLFSSERRHKIRLPAHDKHKAPANILFLVQYLCENVMTDKRRDLFVMDDTVRPGILVLVNDADWELEGEGEYVLQDGDDIMFVSTLHGGRRGGDAEIHDRLENANFLSITLAFHMIAAMTLENRDEEKRA